MAFPLGGGPGIRVFGPGSLTPLKWSRDGRWLFLSIESSFYSGMAGKTYIVPLAAGRMWPELPPHGFAVDSDVSKLPNVRTLDVPDAVPGPSVEVYAFSRERTQRNLYRIPLP